MTLSFLNNRFSAWWTRGFRAGAPADAQGVCHTCERPSAWRWANYRFRCSYCGGDPLEHAAE